MPMTFRDALLSRAGSPGQPTLKKVAEGAKVSYEQLKKLKQGKSQSTNADDAVKIAAWFGMTLNEFIDDHLAEDRAVVADLYSQLEPEEIQILLDAAHGRSGRDPAPIPQ